MSSRQKSVELLISGYVREQETKLKLYMQIPEGISKIMHNLYPVLLFKFCVPDSAKFEIDDNRTILKPKSNAFSPQYQSAECLIYADLAEYNNIGLKEGIHLWSIKRGSVHSSSLMGFGITTKKTADLIHK